MDKLKTTLKNILIAIQYALAPEELKLKAHKLDRVWSKIDELNRWCSHDRPEIGYACMYIQSDTGDIREFRERLRSGRLLSFARYKRDYRAFVEKRKQNDKD